MKKTKAAILLLIGFIATSSSFAQSPKTDPGFPVQVGNAFLNFGIGAGVNYRNYFTDGIYGAKIALEFAVWQAGPGSISLGGETGLSFSNGRRGGFAFLAAARSAWHCGWHVPGLDTYGGFSVGAGLLHSDNKVYYPEGNNYDDQLIPVPGAFAGASYFINPHFGFNAEAGSDITHFQIGIIFKLR